MKRIALLICSVFSVGVIMAQVPGGGAQAIVGRISGVVIDSLTQQPLDYATVSLGRSSSTKNTNGSLTDEKGAFKIDNVSPNTYRLTIAFMGYQTKVIDLVKTTPEKPDLNLGRIILSPNQKMLNAVVVEGQAAIVENKVDKVVYNAEKDATVSGGDAGDVLRKVPMVAVDQDGNVSLRGNQNVKILINGKPSGAMAGNVADAMKMLPADQIKNVEVITSPSAKYDAEGSAGIINIVTKKKNISGVSGSIGGGVGLRHNNGNANLNINQNRLSITANAGGNLMWPQKSTVNFSSKGENFSTVQTGESTVQRYGYVTSGNVSYDINSANSISSGIRMNRGRFSIDGIAANTTIAGSETRNYSIDNDSKTYFGGFDWNADYTHKFKKQGHELTFAGQWSHMISAVDYTTRYSAFDTNQIANNDAKNDEYTVQTDYVLPLTDSLKFETGIKAISRTINSDYDFFNPNASGVFVFNPITSNQYNYGQNVYSGYTVFTFQLKNSWGIQAGGRVEHTRIDGNAQNAVADLNPFSNNYTNFIPSFSVSKTVKSTTFKLSYSKRIQRPSLQFLNPFRNTSNPQNQSMGNPYLLPEISQTIEFSYATFIKGSSINASVYFKRTDDIIERVVNQVSYEGREVALTQFGNIGANNSIGASFFGMVNPVKNLTLRGNVNIFTYKPTVSGDFQSLANNNHTYVQYNAFVSGSYKFPKGFIAETFMNIHAPRRTFQGRNPSFNMWVLSVNKEIFKKKGKIGINVVDPFNERKNFKSQINSPSLVQSNTVSVPFRSVGINFSWQFGKMNFNAQQSGKKKRGVNNDDLKQGDSQGGQSMGQ